MARRKYLRRNRHDSVKSFQHPGTDKVPTSKISGMETQGMVHPSTTDDPQCEEQRTVVMLSETPPASSFLERREKIDPSHSHHRSPESVLFESQPSEIVCCEELSPKIIPRLTKIRLNLDIPENDSASDERDSDKTNSLSEKTSIDSDHLENKEFDEACKNQALEKTISIDEAFPSNSDTIDIPTLKQISGNNGSGTFMNSDVISSLNNLIDGNTGHTVLTDRRALSLAGYTGGVNFPGVFACSTGLEASSTILSKNQVSRNLDEPKACNYFDVPLSAESEELAQACSDDKPSNGLDSEFPWISEVYWYTQTGREIFPNDQRSELLKIRGALEAKKSGKQKTCEKSPNFGKNDANEYFRTRTGSPPAKRCRTTLMFNDVVHTNSLFLPIRVQRPLGPVTRAQGDECVDENVKIDWDTTSQSPISIMVPIVSDSDLTTMVNESHVTMHPNSTNETKEFSGLRKSLISRFREIKIPTTRIAAFCEWLAKRLISIIKRSYRTTCRSFVSVVTPSRRASLLAEEELTQVISLIRCENERMLSVLSEKVTYLSNELAQVRVNSETTLSALTSEMSGIREINSKLADNNDLLAKELKSLTNVLEKSQSISNTKSMPIFAPSPPPPPPPPPPAPASSQPITPTTPNSSRARTIRTPTRKCSTPLLGGRPAITVDDLLKVTLKKAPQNNKENRRNTVPGPRGPVVSLDMLRSVKLKSARRRSSDFNVRSPRRGHSLKIRPAPSLSLSPIMAGADSPLERILRQVDAYPRRGSKRALSSPTHSENDLTRESPRKFDAVRHSKSHSVIA